MHKSSSLTVMTQPVLVRAFIIKFMTVNALVLKEQYTKYQKIFSHIL